MNCEWILYTSLWIWFCFMYIQFNSNHMTNPWCCVMSYVCNKHYDVTPSYSTCYGSLVKQIFIMSMGLSSWCIFIKFILKKINLILWKTCLDILLFEFCFLLNWQKIHGVYFWTQFPFPQDHILYIYFLWLIKMLWF